MANGLCSKCQEPLDGAHKAYCKKCHAAYNQARRQGNPDEARAQLRAWQKANPDKTMMFRRVQNIRRYGFTLEEAKLIASKDSHTCEICLSPMEFGRGLDKFSVDHDHATGEIRGLVCQGCNMLLERAKDSQWVLSQAHSLSASSRRPNGKVKGSLIWRRRLALTKSTL